MTMTRDLFLAIMSMDSYNRGYGVGIKGLNESGRLGNATIRESGENEQDGWQAAGFYALAYDMTGVTNFTSGERVISVRRIPGTPNSGDTILEFRGHNTRIPGTQY